MKLLTLIALVAALVGCGGVESAPRCEAGRVQSCPCAGGATGTQECGPSGAAWSVCVCSSDAGTDVAVADGAADAAGDAPTVPDAAVDAVLVDGAPALRLYESCDLGGDCGAGLECLAVPGLDGGTRGVCSVRCTAATAERCPGALPYPGQVCIDGVCLVNCDRATGPTATACTTGQRCVRVERVTFGTSGNVCVP